MQQGLKNIILAFMDVSLYVQEISTAIEGCVGRPENTVSGSPEVGRQSADLSGTRRVLTRATNTVLALYNFRGCLQFY